MWYYVARYQKPFEAPLNVLSGVYKPTWPTAPDINFVFITWCSSYIQRTAGGSPSNPAFPQHRSCWLENEDTLLHCWRFLCRLLVFSFSGFFLSAKAWAWLTCCLSAAFCPVFLQPFSHCFLFWPAGHGIKKHIKQTRHQVQNKLAQFLAGCWCCDAFLTMNIRCLSVRQLGVCSGHNETISQRVKVWEKKKDAEEVSFLNWLW